jgi:cytidyltransferase-like protein
MSFIKLFLLIFLIISQSLTARPLTSCQDLSFLNGKTLGYYPGSFDPIHQGHMEVVTHSLKYCDYTLVYPAPGRDSFKNRSSFGLRTKMLKVLYANHSKILITDLSPSQIQKALSKVRNLKVIGIIGSDTALEKDLKTDLLKKKYRSIFMRGLSLQPGSKINKHANTTVGALAALKADSFLVNIREQDSLKSLPTTTSQGKTYRTLFDGRKIAAVISIKNKLISSTQIRNLIQKKGFLAKELENIIDKRVLRIAKDNNLYFKFKKLKISKKS